MTRILMTTHTNRKCAKLIRDSAILCSLGECGPVYRHDKKRWAFDVEPNTSTPLHRVAMWFLLSQGVVGIEDVARCQP